MSKIVIVKVKPNSRIESVTKDTSGRFIIRVNPPPEKGLANKRAGELLATYLGVPKSSVSLRIGGKGALKRFLIAK